MVEIYIGSTPENKRKADAEDSMEMIRQVMDIFDLSIRVVDYSKSFKMPKTATNKEIFEGLGFTDSLFPYRRSYADVYVYGILIMQNAFVQVKKGNKQEYTVSLISESKEIWKVVENNTLADLDLSDTEHTKSATLIKNQWESGLTPDKDFVYFLGDYGGPIPNDNTVQGDYLVPSYRLSYLVDKINTKYGVNVVLPEFLDDTFITFSDANEIEETNDKVVFQDVSSTPKKMSEILYQIVEDGVYDIAVSGVFHYAFYMYVSIGNAFHQSAVSNGFIGSINYNATNVSLKKGDSLKLYSDPAGRNFTGVVQITRKAIDVSGNKAFQNYKITDFLKEIIYQSAAIPIKTGSTYDFITLTEIIENDAADWSRYFDRSEEDTYIIGKYGQNNWLRYKYAESEDTNKDGLISIGNVNLDTNKDIIKSTLYNTPVNSIDFMLGGTPLKSQQYHLWKRTVEQKNGVFVERYQGQSGRMFLITGSQEVTTGTFTIKVGTGTVTTNKLLLANNEDYNFQAVINKRYREYSKILQAAELKDAVFKVPLIEFANFDFKRRIYVSQLGGYFIINRMQYKSEELMKIELIEANISPEKTTPIGPIEPPVMSIVFASNLAAYKNISGNEGQLIEERLLILNTDPTGQTFELFIDGASYPFIIASNEITFTYESNIDITYGEHEITLSNGTEITSPAIYRLSTIKPGLIIEPGIPTNPGGPQDPYFDIQPY